MQSHGIYCRSFAILQLSCAEAACNWAKHSGAEGAWETQPYGTRDACDRVVRSKRGGVSRGAGRRSAGDFSWQAEERDTA